MSKEYIEALKTIKIKCHPNSNPNPLVDEALDIVEQALQRLESIDNANPSEALEELKKFTDLFDTRYNRFYINVYETIEQALLKAQEQEKVLEIILKKCVDIDYLKNDCHFVLVLYNKIMEDSKQLTLEEFDLLKRYLK